MGGPAQGRAGAQPHPAHALARRAVRALGAPLPRRRAALRAALELRQGGRRFRSSVVPLAGRCCFALSLFLLRAALNYAKVHTVLRFRRPTCLVVLCCVVYLRSWSCCYNDCDSGEIVYSLVLHCILSRRSQLQHNCNFDQWVFYQGVSRTLGAEHTWNELRQLPYLSVLFAERLEPCRTDSTLSRAVDRMIDVFKVDIESEVLKTLFLAAAEQGA